MTPEQVKLFLNYGPLGVFSAVLLVVVIKLIWWLIKDNSKQLKALSDNHFKISETLSNNSKQNEVLLVKSEKQVEALNEIVFTLRTLNGKRR